MAQTKRKRRRKHRGTQAGTIEARGRTGRTARPQTAADRRQVARERRQQRFDQPPSWRSSFNRALLSAVVFAVFVVIAFGWSVARVAPLAVVMVLVYMPMGYFMDRALYNRRQRRKAAERAR